MFQWGRGVIFQLGRASILSEGCTPLEDIGFDVGFLKNRRMWGRPFLPFLPHPLWETQNSKPRLGGSGGMKECLKSTLQI